VTLPKPASLHNWNQPTRPSRPAPSCPHALVHRQPLQNSGKSKRLAPPHPTSPPYLLSILQASQKQVSVGLPEHLNSPRLQREDLKHGKGLHSLISSYFLLQFMEIFFLSLTTTEGAQGCRTGLAQGSAACSSPARPAQQPAEGDRAGCHPYVPWAECGSWVIIES